MADDHSPPSFGDYTDETWDALVADGLSLGFGPDFDFQYTDPTEQHYGNIHPFTLSPPRSDPYGSSTLYNSPPAQNTPPPAQNTPSLAQNTFVYRSGFDHVHSVDTANLGFVVPDVPTDTADLGLDVPDAPTQDNTRSSPTLKPRAGRIASIVPLDTDEARRRSSSGSTSDDAAAELEKANRKFTREKPKYDPKHPWHRINTTTQGLTKRSGKINQYSAEEMYKQNIANPFGSWSSPGYQFDYLEHGELAKLEYTADEIKEFIYHHPVSTPHKLRIWIQKTPADSCRRYPSATLSKCRFQECPLRRENLNGTIQPGHMRVALDERSAKYGDRADPFYMAANFHLYCFEQCLDLPDICALKNVEVLADTRQLMNEPNMKWNASLSNVKEGVVAKRFIESCRKGRSPIKGFDGYPRPQPGVSTKPHALTLNHRMQQAKEGDRARSAKASLANRPQRPTQLNVNLGDLEMLVQAKVALRKPPPPPKPKRRKRDGEWYPAFSSDEDSDNGDGDASGPDARAKRPMRKKRRTGDGPGGDAMPAAAGPAYAQPTSDWPSNDTASPLGYGGGQYAWPQYATGLGHGFASASTSGGDPAHHFTTTANAAAGIAGRSTEISADPFAIDPSLNDMFPNSAPPLPDYPPMGGVQVVSSLPSPPATVTTRRSSVTVPGDYPLDPDFSLSKPSSKRSAPPDDDDDEDSNGNNNAKRRRVASSDSDRISPRTLRSSTRKAAPTLSPSPPVQTPKTPKTPRRRSSRLSSKAGGSGGGSDKGRSTFGSSGADDHPNGSLGSLFEYDY